MDDDVKESLQKTKAVKEEINDMWSQMTESFGLEKVTIAEETYKEKQQRLKTLNEEKETMKEWFD